MESEAAPAAGESAKVRRRGTQEDRGPGRRWNFRVEDQIFDDFEHDAGEIVSSSETLTQYATRYKFPSKKTLDHRQALNTLLRNMAKDPARVAAAEKGIIKNHLNGLIDNLINDLPQDTSLNESLSSTPELNRSLGLNDSLGPNDSLGFNDSRAPTSPSGYSSFVDASAHVHSMGDPAGVSPVPVHQEGSADGGGGVDHRRKSEGDAASGNQVNRVIQVLDALKIGISNWAGAGTNDYQASITARKFGPGLHSCWPGTT